MSCFHNFIFRFFVVGFGFLSLSEIPSCYSPSQAHTWFYLKSFSFSCILREKISGYWRKLDLWAWVILFARQRRLRRSNMDQGAREWENIRGSFQRKKSCCIGKLCLWRFGNISCLSGLRDPCREELEALQAPEDAILMTLYRILSRLQQSLYVYIL